LVVLLVDRNARVRTETEPFTGEKAPQRENGKQVKQGTNKTYATIETSERKKLPKKKNRDTDTQLEGYTRSEALPQTTQVRAHRRYKKKTNNKKQNVSGAFREGERSASHSWDRQRFRHEP
jgi:hypothetical protein